MNYESANSMESMFMFLHKRMLSIEPRGRGIRVMNTGALRLSTSNSAVPDSALQASVITAPQEFLNLEKEWNALAAESGGETVFQRHEWVSAWWNTQCESSRLFVIVVRRGSELMAIAPLCIVVRQQAFFRFRHLQVLGAPVGDYADFLVKGDRQPSIAIILGEIFHFQHLWDVFEFNHLRADSPNAVMLLEELNRKRVVYSEGPHLVSPYLPLPQDPEHVFLKLPNSLRYKLRRGARELTEYGVVTYEVLREHRAAMEALPGFLETLHRREVGAGRVGAQDTEEWFKLYLTQLLNGPASGLVHFSQSVCERQTRCLPFWLSIWKSLILVQAYIQS